MLVVTFAVVILALVLVNVGTVTGPVNVAPVKLAFLFNSVSTYVFLVCNANSVLVAYVPSEIFLSSVTDLV